MKYCLRYARHNKYLKEVDEVIVPFQIEDIHFVETLTGKNELQNACIIVDVLNTTDFINDNSIAIFLDMQKSYPDMKFKLRFAHYNASHDELFIQLKEANIPFFFTTHVNTLDYFQGLMDLGVSDIYIVEDLGFELKKLGPVAHAKDISIRAFANVCQTSWPHKSNLKSFFIRPEDVPVYEEYVDVLEFYGDYNMEKIMYRVYSKDKKWFGNLQEIIIGLSDELDSRYLLPQFARVRVGCGKRCIKGTACNICEKIVVVSQTLEEKGYMVKLQN